MNCQGHAVLVSGGASGLGEATARHLAKAGARVAILDLNEPRAKEVAAEIGGIGLACDVSSAASAEAAVAQARAAHGPARILVNCAGIGEAKRIVGRTGAMPLESFERVIKINLIGSFNLLRLVASDMTTLDVLPGGERGVIISTASIAAYDGQIGQAAYAASKGGIVSLTLPAAREFARFGIRVCAIAPGIFQTPLLAGLPEAAQKSLGDSVPFPPRLGQPAEYAALVGHIVENAYLNGEVIRLDAALRMQPS